ncbi:MAG: hypothetical protein LBS46_07660 [Dysgonamonadaceae bacterium]|jgi:hypothetical protein|nr:hypothetical protein [Dysgonamonadaceae bacterium]
MILTALRIIDIGHIATPMICSDSDFQTVLELGKILNQYAAKVFSDLPAEQETTKQPNQKQLFLEALPPEFSCKANTNLTCSSLLSRSRNCASKSTLPNSRKAA